MPLPLGDRQGVIDYLPGSLLLELRSVSFRFSRHSFPSFPGENPTGSPVRKRWGTSTQHQWKQLSSPARGRFLQALGPSLTAVERIRHRSSAPLPRLPADSAELLAVRARKIPQMLWPYG